MSGAPILVVEDNPLTRKMLRLTLESEGYAVVEASDGRSALAAAQEQLPALVLQDLILPDMNGFELVRQLRALTGPGIPMLALSGFLNQVENARGAAAGFDALLVKPIEPTRLLEVIGTYLPMRTSAPPSGAGQRVLVVDDDAIQLKLTGLHLTQLGFRVLSAATAREALHLARETPPDVILADVLMPDLDGFQLCVEIHQDAKLCGIPVILCSAWYETSADRELAARVGAAALVQKTPDLKGIPEVIARLSRPLLPVVMRPPDLELRYEHARAVIRQLERQVVLSAGLARRCTLQAAQISLLSGVADALKSNQNAEAALRDVLAATLDAAGISKGALYLYADGPALELRHAIGFSEPEQRDLSTFFGHRAILEDAAQRQATLSLPSSHFSEELARGLISQLGAVSAQIVPLISDGRGMGVMVLCARHSDVTNEDSIAFARAMGNQLAQSLDLARSFARLASSERRYRAVTEAAHEVITILGPDGAILEANPSFVALLGLPREHIVGRRLQDLAPVAARDTSDTQWATLLTDACAGGEVPVSLARADGSIVLVEFSGRHVEVGGEQLVVSVGRDVTERVKTQAQLMFSDRMASIGALAAGVAHEINNPLMATVANLEFALEHTRALSEICNGSELAPLDEALRDAMEGADRVRTIVRDLKIFSRAEEDNRGPVDLQRVLESSLRMARNEIRHRAQLLREYAVIPPVEANESRLGQVFLNLVVNAAQALPEGQANQNQIRVRTRRDAGGRIVADVEDTGPGMSPELLSRLFTPFFTTKPRGVGTGLGLSICKRIVDSFGGEITVQSVPGQGTCFSVHLQPAAAQPEAAPLRFAAVPSAPRRGRVLIVDDDEKSALVVSRALSLEHDVATSHDADEALERIARQTQAYDVIICDMMMPVKTGVDFFADLSERDPAQSRRIVFLTGGAFTVKTREFLDRVPNTCLEKPFDLRTLRAVVNRMLLDPG
jgi:PAS domain S-box-containing protein